MARKVSTYTVTQKGIGSPDYSATALQEPWVGAFPQRQLLTAGWMLTNFLPDFTLPAKTFVPFSELTADEIEEYGIEAILMEWWIASSPNVYCQCFIGDVMVCSPIGCCPALCYASGLTDPSLPVSTHIYDAEAGRYGIICRFRKDIGRGYPIKHGLFNDEVTDQTCEIAAVSYQRKIRAK